jgi:hypothetical protein
MPLKKADVIFYVVVFIIVFDFFFLPTFSDSRETTGIYIIASVILGIGSFILFFVVRYAFKKWNVAINVFGECVLLYFLSELLTLISSGGIIGFWGLAYRLHLLTNSTEDLIVFREKSGFGSSMSFLIAAAICLLQKLFFSRLNRKDKPIA